MPETMHERRARSWKWTLTYSDADAYLFSVGNVTTKDTPSLVDIGRRILSRAGSFSCVLAVILSLIVNSSEVFASASRSDPRSKAILYTDYAARSQLCKALAELFTSARRINPDATYINEIPEGMLKEHSIDQPDWLSEDDPAFVRFPTGGRNFCVRIYSMTVKLDWLAYKLRRGASMAIS
jgi:hypothetical protein